MKCLLKAMLSVVLFTSSAGVSFAQSNFKKAIIIKRDGDTLSGFVNFREWYRNPKEFYFRSSVDDIATETFTVKNVGG